MLKKSKSDNKVLFADASDQFVLRGNKNVLAPEHQDFIVETLRGRTDVEFAAALVDAGRIADNGYNLSASSYVEP